MPENIRPRDLPPVTDGIVNPNAATIVDGGGQVQRATPIQLVDAAAPIASQADAEAGTDNGKRMTPLRARQGLLAMAPAIVDAVVPLASQSEAETGTDNTRRMSPLRVTQAVAALSAVKSVAGKIGNIVLGKADVGLSAVDNTSDINKPVSNATAASLNAKVNRNGDVFTGLFGRDSQFYLDLNSLSNPIINFDAFDSIRYDRVADAFQVRINGGTRLDVNSTSISYSGNTIWHAGNFNPASYQPILGFTPLEQGGGVGMSPNKVRIGWNGFRLLGQVDNTALGALVADRDLPFLTLDDPRWRVVRDGATDNTAALQALAAYVNGLPDGARVNMGTGYINFTGNVTFSKSVVLSGTSVSATALVAYNNARLILDGNRTNNPFFGLENLTLATDGIHATSPLCVDYSPHADGALSNTFQMDTVVVRGRNATSGFADAIQLVDCPWPKFKNVTIIGDYGTSGGFLSNCGIRYTGQDGSPSWEGVRCYSVRYGIFAEGEMEGYVVNDCEFVSVQRGITFKDTTNGLQPLASITNSHFNCEESAITLDGITEFNISGNDIYCQGALGIATLATMVDIVPTRATGSNTNVCSGAIHGNAFNGDGGFAATKTAIRVRGNAAGIELYRIYGNHYQGLSEGRRFDAGTNGVQVDEATETFINVVTRHIDNGAGNSRQMRTAAGSTVGVTDSNGRVAIVYGPDAAFTTPPIPVVCGGDGNGGETFSVVEASRSTSGCSAQAVRAGTVVAAGQTFRINWIASGI